MARRSVGGRAVSAADPAADTSPASLDALDALIVETMADVMSLSWNQDRPLLPREARAILTRHAANPAAVQPGRSRETVHAAERQLRMQAAAFDACAAALRSGDPALVPSDNPPGSGHAEVLELLTDAGELRALLPEGSAERAALDAEHVALAVEFEVAAQACIACAVHLQAQRFAIHGRDYQAILLAALKAEEAEAHRRAASAAKAGGASA